MRRWQSRQWADRCDLVVDDPQGGFAERFDLIEGRVENGAGKVTWRRGLQKVTNSEGSVARIEPARVHDVGAFHLVTCVHAGAQDATPAACGIKNPRTASAKALDFEEA